MGGYDFFIAYSTPDKELATRIARALGDRVFIDHEAIEPGEEWPAKVAHALQNSSVIVVLVGEQPGHYFKDEVTRAIDRHRQGTKVVPVLVHDGVQKPYGLEIIQHLNLERGRAVDTVVARIRKVTVDHQSPPALMAIDAYQLLPSLVLHNRVSTHGAEVVACVKERWPSSFDQAWRDHRDGELNRTILDGLIPRYSATVVVLDVNFIRGQNRTSFLANVRERAMASRSGPVFVLGDGPDAATEQIVGECPLVRWYREPSREVRQRELLAAVDLVLENKRR